MRRAGGMGLIQHSGLVQYLSAGILVSRANRLSGQGYNASAEGRIYRKLEAIGNIYEPSREDCDVTESFRGGFSVCGLSSSPQHHREVEVMLQTESLGHCACY